MCLFLWKNKDNKVFNHFLCLRFECKIPKNAHNRTSYDYGRIKIIRIEYMVTVIWYMASLWFLSHIWRATVVASPICRQKTQTSHVSNDSDHVFYLSYLKTGFLWQFPMIFHWNFVAFDLFALRMDVISGQCTKIFSLHFFTFQDIFSNFKQKNVFWKFWYYDTVLISLILRLCEHSKGMIKYQSFLLSGDWKQNLWKQLGSTIKIRVLKVVKENRSE